MKYYITLVLALSFQGLFSQNLTFLNSNLKTYLLTENSVDLDGDEFPDTIIDLNGDNEIQPSEALLVQNLVISPPQGTIITSIQDIYQFSNLKKLTLQGGFGLVEISNLGVDSLEFIRVANHTSITDIDFSDLPNLSSIWLNGLNGVQNLNLQNGSFATDSFSLFYTYVQFACVDSISTEYNIVSQHLVNGGTISTNCALGINENQAPELVVYPNPSKGIFNFDQKFESAELYDLSGKLVKVWDQSSNKINISNLDNGIYFLRLKLNDRTIVAKKIMKN